MDANEVRKYTLPIYRIAVLGAKKVGKTSIINSFVNNSFDPIYEETDTDIRKYRRVYDLNRGESNPLYVIFQIEDIFPVDHEDLEDESDFAKNTIYYHILENKPIRAQGKANQNILQADKQIYGYIFVYDVNTETSFKAITDVVKYIKDYCETKCKYSGLDTKKIMVANKVDLLDFSKQNLSVFEDKKWFFDKYPMPKYAVSAKTSLNITTIFEELGKSIQNDIKMELKERDWFSERAVEMKNILTEKQKQLQNEKGKGKKDLSSKGVLGCLARGKSPLDFIDNDDDNIEINNEDDEFENVPQYSVGMDQQNDSCKVF